MWASRGPTARAGGRVCPAAWSRFLKKKVREHPAKAVRKAESKYIKATADYHFHTAAQEHPELTQNALSRFWQKKRLRKQYQKRAKEAAKQGARAAEKLPLPRKSWRFGPWALSNAIPWGVCWLWPVFCWCW